MWNHNEKSSNHTCANRPDLSEGNGENKEKSSNDACANRRLTGNISKMWSGWKIFRVLFKKDCQMMSAGKFFLVAFGSLIIYMLFINFGYVNFMNAELYNVYLFDPQGTQKEVSELIYPVNSLEELNAALSTDANGVGIDFSSGTPDIVFYFGSEKADHHRADYALSLLRQDSRYTTRTVGTNTPEQKQRKEMSCELLFIEITAVGFLGIAALLFKEKEMGVIRVHAVLPCNKSLFIISKIMAFLLSDFIFAALMTVLNIGFYGAADILPGVLIQTAILSLIMALMGFGCAMLLKDFRQFSLAYLVIAIFVAAPVFLSANTSVKMAWIDWHPFYHVYMGLKNAYFGMPVVNPVYYICSACGVVILFLFVQKAFCREMEKEG